MTILANILLVAGLFFIAVSTYALFSMPDVYTRAHAVAKSETVGLMLVFAGVFLRPEMTVNAYGRLAAVLVFALIANPTAVHALLRAAIRSGTEPWKTTGQEEADRELERYR
jgi:multicomponent Na+:H+ antiporter subunit G